MKLNLKTIFSRSSLVRAVSPHLIAWTIIFLGLPGMLPAQTLLHRYSFVSDASDSVGSANGTLVAPTTGSPATISSGLMLPGSGGGFGTSGYVSLPSGILTNTSSLTVECWVTQNSGNGWAEVWDFGIDGSHNFALIPDPDNNNHNMEVAFTPHGNEIDLQSDTAFPTGTEQYVALTFNNATLTADLYTNGVLDAMRIYPDATYTPGTIGGAGGTTQNMLGNDVYGDAQFNGTIFELRIWNGVVSQRYVSASALLGSSILVTNLAPASASLAVASDVVITGTDQAAFTVTLSQTGTNELLATSDATNWTSANTNIVTVNKNGLVTGVGIGSTTVSAMIDGVKATSASITVTPQTLEHRYSFVSDASDSVGGPTWDGTLQPPATGSAATISNGLFLPGNTVGGPGGFGYSGYVSFPSGILTNTTSVTVECWLTQNQGIGWAEAWDFGNNGNENFALIPDPDDNNSKLEAAFNPNANNIELDTPTAFPNGAEQYVVVTFNNSTLIGDLYTNGVLDASQAYPLMFPSYAPGAIGGAGGTTENMLGNDVYGDPQFDGTVYEFRIWNGAVSPAYVAVSAAAGPTNIVTNVTPSLLTVSVATNNLIGAQTEQATVIGNFTEAAGVNVTGAAVNWTSSNPNVLSVSSSGLITALSGGNATVSATVSGVTATSPSITVADTVPLITQQPTPVTVAVGGSATFTVAAIGGGLTYQWSDGASPILGATNATLTLTNLSFGQAGNYSVLVTNALGSTNSDVVTLAVDQAILEHRYSFVSDASDSVGGPSWNGTLVAGSGGNPATINNGVVLPGNSGGGYGVSGYVSFPSGILVGDTSVSVECWVQPNSDNTWAEIWDFGSSGSINFALIQYNDREAGTLSVAFTPNGGEVDILTPNTLPASSSETYTVVTYDNANLTGDLYTNGVLDSSVLLPNSGYSPGSYGGPGGTTQDMLGNDVYGDPQFGGTVYELRIWNGVISQRYIAASTLLGSSNLVTNVTPTSATIIVSNTMTGETSQQAQVDVTLSQTGTNELLATDDATNWVSSNPNILTVNNTGLITAVGGGSATISATVGGIIGTSASITVPLTAPSITQEPAASESILVGGTLHTSVVNDGVEPYFYHWYFNTSSQPISGANTATLTIPNVQAANAGSYTVIVSNAYGSVTSTPTALTVVAPTAFQANLLALSPLAYWPLSETSGTIAYDMAGGYDGTYVGSVALGQAGPTNASFGSPSLAAGFDGATAYVDIPEGPFDITNAITTMAWVQIANFTTFDGIFGHGDTSWRMTLNPTGNPGANDGNVGSADATSPTAIVDNNWHFLVYTFTGDFSKANNGSLYVDGALVAHDTIALKPPGNGLDVWIAGAPDYGTGRLLPGNIAHAAIFAQALSAADVQALFASQVILDITRSGSNVVLTWSSGTLLQAPSLLGPWTTNSAATSPFTTAATNTAEFYKIQVP